MTDEKDFEILLKEVLEDPSLILNADITPEQVLKIQKHLNPYGRIAGGPQNPDKKKVLVCSYTNLREDYLRRFIMTGMISFLFQLQDEWEVPIEKRRWTPSSQSDENEVADLDKISESLTSLTEVVNNAQTAKKEVAELKKEIENLKAKKAEHDLLETADDTLQKQIEEKEQQLSRSAETEAALLYVSTYTLNKLGKYASTHLRATAQNGMKYPEIKNILKSNPLPPPPSQLEIPPAMAKDIIKNFLQSWFKFDPSIHVRSAHSASAIEKSIEEILVNDTAVQVDSKDPEHLTLSAVKARAVKPKSEHKAAVNMITSSDRNYNSVVHLLRDDDLLNSALAAFSEPDVFKHYLLPLDDKSSAHHALENIPPQDTFHRFNYYTEVNYEKIKTVTEAIYPEKSDLDWALGVWDVIEGSDVEIDTAFEDFCKKYQDEVPSAIKALDFGAWSLLADYSKNRSKVEIYNKNTDILKRILDRHADDKRIGAELMRNRVRQVKAKNIAEEGPDAAGLIQYKKNVSENSQDLVSKGAERVISPEEMKRLEKAQGNIKAAQELELLDQCEETIRLLGPKVNRTKNEEEEFNKAVEMIPKIKEMLAVPDDAIQVDVFTNDTTGNFKKSHFYTKAEEPDHLKTDTVDTSVHPAVSRSIRNKK